MRKVSNVVVILSIVLILGALLIGVVARAREFSNRLRCQTNLSNIGMAVAMYEEDYKVFPLGTLPNEALPPEKRLSWMVSLGPYVEGGWLPRLDQKQAWDSPHNVALKWRRKHGGEDNDARTIPWVLCPVNLHQGIAEMPRLGPMHYVGIAGVGRDSATLPLTDRRAGVFGYDRGVRLQDITDGKSTTMMMAETMRNVGPWTAGGPATVRGLEPGGPPFIGPDGQFSANHRSGQGWFSMGRPHATHVHFVDRSVRAISTSIDPKVIEAMATIAGEEHVNPNLGE